MKEIKYILTFPVTEAELKNEELINELRQKVLTALLNSKELDPHSMFTTLDWGRIR